ncbi:hypothetical protein ABE28_003960 [Peribacillus muralis]|uniref:Uncharacterized protein n=1 Tax=Peribacillus muralis TaxID=264697 RepID=A0A1B3XJW9_9BACI|nr:hypothetical protein [Peribacillus muralis]AOH53496.1 hypothetical protein ABE28_003960 [Peribacillus muralis]
MRWAAFFSTAFIVTVIILYEWPKIKRKPAKDKIALISLLLIGLLLSMFNLQEMAGPTSWIEALFRPLGEFMER